MTFNLFDEIRRATEAWLAANTVGIPDSIREFYRPPASQCEEPFERSQDEDQRLDDPRHGQAESLNRERYRP